MANYANNAGYANAFGNLTGLLNMFIQNEMQRSNIKDDRAYKEETDEKRFIDNLVGNAVKYVQNGKANLYGTYYGDPVSNGTRTVVSKDGTRKVVPVATAQRLVGDKIDNIDYSNIVSALKNGDYVVRPNEDITDSFGNNKLIEIEPSLIEPINRVYGTKFTNGTKLPAGVYTSMISGLNANNRRNSGLTDAQLLKLYDSQNKQGNDILTGDEVKNSALYKLIEEMVDQRFQTKGKKKGSATKNNDPLGIR